MIQVSSGLLRSVQLRSPTGSQTRPSSERLRQGTFNVLRNFRWPDHDSIVDGAVVFDLFAGTGAWGIEALSNGAAEAWFVESHAGTLKTLEENVEKAARCFEKQQLAVPAIHVVRRDALQAYRKLPRARLIFCDPPYEQGWFEKMLQVEDEAGLLETGGVYLYESALKEKVPENIRTLKHYDTKIYGDSAVHFFVKL